MSVDHVHVGTASGGREGRKGGGVQVGKAEAGWGLSVILAGSSDFTLQ